MQQQSKFCQWKWRRDWAWRNRTSFVVKTHYVVVVCGRDWFPYFPLISTAEYVKDDYGHYISANTKIIEGNYDKFFKEPKERDLHYFDWSKSTTRWCFEIVGICPVFAEVEQMRLKKTETVFLVTHKIPEFEFLTIFILVLICLAFVICSNTRIGFKEFVTPWQPELVLMFYLIENYNINFLFLKYAR